MLLLLPLKLTTLRWQKQQQVKLCGARESELKTKRVSDKIREREYSGARLKLSY